EERSGYVYINGKKLDEPYIKPDRRDPDTHAPVKIAPGHYFMMGDNRRSSCDSRRWGTVSRSELIGKVIATYWPPNRISVQERRRAGRDAATAGSAAVLEGAGRHVEPAEQSRPRLLLRRAVFAWAGAVRTHWPQRARKSAVSRQVSGTNAADSDG